MNEHLRKNAVGIVFVLLAIVFAIDKIGIFSYEFSKILISWGTGFTLLGIFLINVKEKRIIGSIFLIVGLILLIKEISILNDFYGWYRHYIRAFGYLIRDFALPIILLAIGLRILYKSRQKQILQENSISQEKDHNDPVNNEGIGQQTPPDLHSTPEDDKSNENKHHASDQEAKMNSNQSVKKLKDFCLFSETEKRYFNNESFNGGNITSIFGSYHLDLTEAKWVNNRVVLDIFVMLGNVEVFLPSHVKIKQDVMTILGGYNDTRRQYKREVEIIEEDANGKLIEKQLVIKGIVLLGGCEIKNG